MDSFGSNPGALQARVYVPAGLPAGSPLVVVLHGCTQSAAAYDHGSGWSRLADELGIALLYPEQQRPNNPNLCFNWFSPADSRRDSGEALSIRQMIDAMVSAHAIDPRRIFVTGLSAGGAMASIMLATYPEVFAGGAIIAGLPFGAAESVGDAFARMRGQGYASDAQLGALVRGASGHRGPWPTLSVWQGSADTTVDPSNAPRIIAQWRAVHGLSSSPSLQDTVDGCARQVWRDAAGRRVIEYFQIDGMGHGTPLQIRGAGACGAPGPYMLDAGISSTRHIAGFWGLGTTKAARQAQPAPATPPPRLRPEKAAIAPERVTAAPAARRPASPVRNAATGVGAVIEDALRAAGLMR
jgi:poly(hydroxyalkanoate) depolymerase family esterase